MGVAHSASRGLGPRRRRSTAALAVLSGACAACAHLPPLIESRDPLSAEEHARLGAVYEAQGLRAEALGQFEAATRRDPAYAEAWVALGNLSFEGGDLARAESSYRRALKASPDHAGASNNLATVYLARDKRLADAERLAQKALRQDGPLKPYIFDTLANVYLRQGRYLEARAAARQAAAAAPPNDAAFHGRTLLTRMKIDAALEEESRARP